MIILVRIIFWAPATEAESRFEKYSAPFASASPGHYGLGYRLGFFALLEKYRRAKRAKPFVSLAQKQSEGGERERFHGHSVFLSSLALTLTLKILEVGVNTNF